MSKLCLFTLQCDVCNETCLVNCYYSFAFPSKIAFRVLPRPNFFYITFFVVNATVVFSCFRVFQVLFLFVYFLSFKFPNRSQKLICLIFVWFVFVFFSCPLKLRLFTKENRAKFTANRCRICSPCRPKCFKCQCRCRCVCHRTTLFLLMDVLNVTCILSWFFYTCTHNFCVFFLLRLFRY